MIDQAHSIAGILQTSEYALDIFTQEEIASIVLFDKNGKANIVLENYPKIT